MTPEQTDLARRLVACPSFRWMPGMLHGEADIEEGGLCHFERCVEGDRPSGGRFPVLADDATLGCLLALVRKAYRCAVITSPDYDEDEETGGQGPNIIGWRCVETRTWNTIGCGATEAEALVNALLTLSETTP